MICPPTQSSQPASLARHVLVKVALVTALVVAMLLLLDAFIQHRLVRLFIQSDPACLFGSWWLLAFLLAVLLGKLRDSALPADRAWSNRNYWSFIMVFCISGFFLMLAVYCVMVVSLIQNNGNGGE